MKLCPVCHAESQDDAKFCGYCGSHFGEVQKKVCPVCRAQLPGDTNFCPHCGRSFIAQSTLAVQPVDDRPIIELERPVWEGNQRYRVVIKKLVDYFLRYPYPSLAILAVILLIPLCCVMNVAFAIRDRMKQSESPEVLVISTVAKPLEPSREDATETPIPTPTSMPVRVAVATTSTATPTQFTYDTGFSGCPPLHTKQEKAKVIKVIDGNTIDVIVNDEPAHVRYLGLDATDLENTSTTADPFWEEAYRKNIEWVEGKDVILIGDQSDVDSYNRLLRYVFVEDLFVNHEMVRAGYAKAFSVPPNVACDDYFLEAQQAAAQAGLGLWGVPTPGVTAAPPAVRMAQTTQPVLPATAAPAGAAVCNCSGPDLDCKDFAGHAQAQACFEYCKPQYGDIFRLDRDNDGLACETQ